MMDVLLADDEVTFRETFAKVLREEGLSVTSVDNGTDAIAAIEEQAYAVAILDIHMPGTDGIGVLREIMKSRPQMRVLMVTAYGAVERAVEAMKLGACDYVVKPVIFDDILTKIRQHIRFFQLQAENRELKRALDDKFDIARIIGQSPKMQMVFDVIHKVGQTKSNVLITGESGTGKELVARAIHSVGSRRAQRFVAVNCGAIAETLLESELFGHKKGSFTSADRDREGMFEYAHGGTLFLDEIGFMSIACQVKLLRAVEQRQVTPVGAMRPVDVDLRLITATNRDLLKEIREDRFREDLYYRINVVGIHLPPLRDRVEDIPRLVEHFVGKYSVELGKKITAVADDALDLLTTHHWQGNVRELENVIERAIIFAETPVIQVCDMGLVGAPMPARQIQEENLQAALKACEKQHIVNILSEHGWDKAEAAKALGVGLSSLYRKLDELEIKIQKK